MYINSHTRKWDLKASFNWSRTQNCATETFVKIAGDEACVLIEVELIQLSAVMKPADFQTGRIKPILNNSAFLTGDLGTNYAFNVWQ